LKARVDAIINNNHATIETILTDTLEYELYSKLTTSPDHGHSIIGKGEAAVIALALIAEGTVASNNLKDVTTYATEFGLRHITTGDILVKAFETSLITEDEGNTIWRAMLAKRRRIGASSFSEYLHTK
jgi:predicted nucleic acid-binding protein